MDIEAFRLYEITKHSSKYFGKNELANRMLSSAYFENYLTIKDATKYSNIL